MWKLKEKNKIKSKMVADNISYDEVLMYVVIMVMIAYLQKRILKEFNTGHLGITRMISLMCACLLFL